MHTKKDSEDTLEKISKPQQRNFLPTLPPQEKDKPIADQLADLKVEIDEMAAALQYMGNLHPRKGATEQELERLQTIYRNLQQLQTIHEEEGEI